MKKLRKKKIDPETQVFIRNELNAIVRITNTLHELLAPLKQELRWLNQHEKQLRQKLLTPSSQEPCDGECLGDHRRWERCRHGLMANHKWPIEAD